MYFFVEIYSFKAVENTDYGFAKIISKGRQSL